MKRLKVLSHLKMRVIPMIMVSTLLCSNFVSVKALAEGEATESTTEVSENGDEPADDSQNDSNDTTEDSSDEADAEDTSSSDDASEGTDEADGEDSSDSSDEGSSDEADADASTEASSEEDASDAASSDMSEEPEDIYVNEDNLEFVSFSIDIEEDGDSDFTITSDIDNTKTVQNEDGQSVTTVDSVEATLNDDSTYDVLVEDSKIAFQYSVNDYYAVEASLNGGAFQEFNGGVIEYSVDQLREDNDLFIKTEGMDIEGPEITNLDIPDYTGNGSVFCFGKSIEPLSFTVKPMTDSEGRTLELGDVKINYTFNGTAKSETLSPISGENYQWAPAPEAYGDYYITSITATHKIGKTTVYDSGLPLLIKYRDKVKNEATAFVENADKWYSTDTTSEFNPKIILTAYSEEEVSYAHIKVYVKNGDEDDVFWIYNLECDDIDDGTNVGSVLEHDITLRDFAKDYDGDVTFCIDVWFDDEYYSDADNSGLSENPDSSCSVIIHLDNSGFAVSENISDSYNFFPEGNSGMSKYYLSFINAYFVDQEAYASVKVCFNETELGSSIKPDSVSISTAENYGEFGTAVEYKNLISDSKYDQQSGTLSFKVHFSNKEANNNDYKVMKEGTYYLITGFTFTDAVGHSCTIKANAPSVLFNKGLPLVESDIRGAYKEIEDPSNPNQKIFFFGSSQMVSDGKWYCGDLKISDKGGFYVVSFTNEIDGSNVSSHLALSYKKEAFVNNESHKKYYKEQHYNMNLPSGEYVINTTLCSANKGSDQLSTLSNKIVVDDVKPEVEVSCDKPIEPSAEDSQEFFCKESATITITVTERYPDLKSLRDAIYFTFNGEPVEPQFPEIVEGDPQSDKIIITLPVESEGKYEFRLGGTIYDLAGNEAIVNNGVPEKFILDRSEPELLPITFDNDDVHNGKYYNKARTATITVRDIGFSPSLSKIEVTSKYGTAKISDWSGDKDSEEHIATVTFDEDGIYSFTVTVYDRAGHGPVTASVEEFVIDTTEPKVTVTYTNNDAKNQMYYNKARTAILDIEEMSFDAELVEYGMQPIDEGSQLPTIGGFSTSEKVNTTNMTFDQDGKYAYVINCTDLAGNTATSYISDIFVIDTIAPEVDFSGVDNFSANNGTVAPTVKYVDKNMDMEATVVTMTGSNNGPVAVGSAVTETEDGFVVSYDDFAHDKSMDDLYTLTAKVYDLAGNESEEELVFSVNRFGSVFVLGDATKILNEEYYTNDPKDITITEINVDELTYRDISISCDGDITELEKGADYTVTSQGSDTTWKTYTYTLSSENFSKDGVYSVTVYTKDRASNTQDNKSRDAEINFAVDMTKPSIVTTGIESDTTYNKSSIGVNINVADNMGLTSFDIFRGEKHVGSYTAEELDSNGGTIEITLEEADKEPFDLKLVAVDVAGNEEVLTYSNVTVAVETTEIVDPPVPLPGPDKDNNKVNIFIFIIIGFGAVALASGAGIFAYQNKKKSE